MATKRSSLAWALALFFFSGATSLVYEVLWTRRLSLTFGHTVLAVSTVLTVFMTGLALGSFLAGRWTDRWRQRLIAGNDPRGATRFLALYGYLEIFIGVWAVLSLALLNGVETVYLGAAQSGADGTTLHALVFLGSFLVLLPPTTAMGATLPIFTQLLVASKEDVGTWLSRIYGWNTLGACCGAALGGFVLLPSLGLRWAVYGAALANLLIGVVALVGVSRLGRVELTSSESEGPERPSSAGGWFLPVAFGISGFAAMLYQIGWTRGLILSIGSSTYSFATILTAFLATLGLGSLVYKRLMGGRTPRLWHLGALQFVIGLSGLAATYGLGQLPAVMVKAIPALEFHFAKILAFDFGLALLLMFVPTLAMGLTFPLVTHLYTDRLSTLGKRLGEAYAANTCGAILGSFSAGFVLVPHWGAQKVLLGAVLVNLTVGTVLAWTDRRSGPRPWSIGAVAALGLGLVWWMPPWDPSQLSAGASIYHKSEHFLFRPAFYKDGVSATVTVGFNGAHSPYLKVNGKTDASVALQDMAHQILTGLLPAALHPQPKRIALVGLGSGVTAAALVALDSVERVHCAELEPAIVEVQKYFGPYTEHVVKHPKLDLQVNDGRTFILGAPQPFDLILSQPSNPWIAGIGNLYTEDFYQACAQRLQPGGLMCQWMQVYSMSQDDLEMVFATFFSVFPEGAVFQIGPGDLMIIGRTTPLEISVPRMERLWAEEDTAAWLQMIGLLRPEYLLGTWVASRDEVLQRLANRAESALNTDDRPLLEYRAPRSLYLQDPNVLGFAQSFPDLLPAALKGQPEAEMGALFGRIQLQRSAGLEPKVQRALEQGYPLAPLAEALLLQRQGSQEQAEGLLRAIPLESAASSEAQILLGDLRRSATQWQAALLHYGLALEDPLPGSSFILNLRAGECALQAGDLDLALEFFTKASELNAQPNALVRAAEVKLQQQDPAGASDLLQQAVERDAFDYTALALLAWIRFQEGQVEEADRLAQASYQAFPELRSNVELLATIALRQGREAEARRYQAEASRLKSLEVGQSLRLQR